jgi:uncharacterized protein YndB with AHSA1/START domain
MMATVSATHITAEPGTPIIEITREFAAPRELLFRAWTEPELLAQWLGPRRLTMSVERFELRDGGRWRYVNRDSDGNEYGFRGVFHGDPSPDRMVQTFEFEGAPGHVSLDSLAMEERNGRTIVRIRSVHQSVEARDAMVAGGMEQGMIEGFERLDELIGHLAAADR